MQVPGASRIVGMRLNRRGNRLLVNCFDRTVRLYDIHQPGKRRRSYTAADLKAKLAASKVCLDSISSGLQDTLGLEVSKRQPLKPERQPLTQGCQVLDHTRTLCFDLSHIVACFDHIHLGLSAVSGVCKS